MSQQPNDPLSLFGRIIDTLNKQDNALINQIAARSMNNLLFLIAKSGTGPSELREKHIAMFWERLAQDFHTIRQLEPVPDAYACNGQEERKDPETIPRVS